MDRAFALFLCLVTFAFAALIATYILTPKIVAALHGDPSSKERGISHGFLDVPRGGCTAQHEKYVGVSTWDLLENDFQVKSAVPGGIWLQKGKKLFYCNSGVIADDDTICWSIIQPARGLDCKTVRDAATARAVGG